MNSFLFGDREIEIKTSTETLLYAALRAVLLEHGHEGLLKATLAELRCRRHAFVDALSRDGTLQILTNGNNLRDIVQMIKRGEWTK